jgi:hypothetical protein
MIPQDSLQQAATHQQLPDGSPRLERPALPGRRHGIGARRGRRRSSRRLCHVSGRAADGHVATARGRRGERGGAGGRRGECGVQGAAAAAAAGTCGVQRRARVVGLHAHGSQDGNPHALVYLCRGSGLITLQLM